MACGGSGGDWFFSPGTRHPAEPFYRKFCSTCGSHVLSDGPVYEGMEFIKAGTLDSGHMRPVTHIWCSQKLEWPAVPEGETTFPGNPG